MGKLNISYEKYIIDKCKNLLEDLDIPSEQVKIMISMYEHGFADAMKLLDEENIIKTRFYT